jgi:uncharacterized protein YggE
VLQRLQALGVAEADLQTTGLNVFRVQEERPGSPGGAPGAPLAVYRGSVTVAVRIADAARAGALLEAAFQAGATSVESLSFGVRDAGALRREAVALAVRDARPKAEAAAAAAGLTLTGVRSVVELPAAAPFEGGLGGGAGAGAGEGVAPGERGVPVRVQVTFGVAP